MTWLGFYFHCKENRREGIENVSDVSEKETFFVTRMAFHSLQSFLLSKRRNVYVYIYN